MIAIEMEGGAMGSYDLDRRDFLAGGSASMMALLISSPAFVHAFPRREGEQLVPFIDLPAAPPGPGFNLQRWEDLDSWITPNEKFFRVSHYNEPQLSEANWRLEVTGMVDRPRTYSLADIKTRPRAEVIFTVECGGNHGLPWFISGIGNARWTGTPLAPMLTEAGIRPGGIEVIFVGHDEGEETVRDVKMKQNFARSMSVEDAMSPANMLCYEMNGVALPAPHGAPARLIAPGWYGVANVKWLKRIEVRGTRFMGKFMARDYVTIREERRDGEIVGVETSVGRARLKSAPSKVTSKGSDYRIYGAAWGGPVARVECQIDGGPWREATIDRTNDAPYAWKIWTLEWPTPSPGEHTITSRATDTQGNVQPAMTDPIIANKKTYWESFGQVTRRVRVT
jgi:DMSO/TMAO reductase YedYZ molybdopterin-dependent catalytic subunit